MGKCAYKRVMLKVSGEALSGENGFGFDFETVGRIAREVIDVYEDGLDEFISDTVVNHTVLSMQYRHCSTDFFCV